MVGIQTNLSITSSNTQHQQLSTAVSMYNTLLLNDKNAQLIMLHIKELTLTSECVYINTTQVNSLSP